MLTFEYSSLIAAPVEVVFGFHQRPDALELLTPPWDPIIIVKRLGGLEVGAQVDLRVKVGPLWLRWIAHHIAYEKNRLFIDEQREGPFAAWVHAHQFAPENDGTRLTDSIEFALPGGIMVEKLAGWAVKRKLQKMFEYRHRVTRRMCEPP
jgi:ligand-binding SRPBCC domain-containing protein